PRTELREVANGYVLLAELPGVRKEDLEVEIGEGGKTVRIEGRAGGRAKAPATAETPAAQEESAEATQPAKPAAEPTTAEATNTDVAAAPTPASEVAPPTQAEYTSTFSQTFTLPRPVDGGRVVARLEDGVLTLVVPFLEDRESVRVTVD
ncbi:HSP20-like chaperone, partial [Calocera cornea HHB12733]